MKVEKDMDKVMKHMDKAHEIFFNTELWMAVNFLNEKEIAMLTSKISSRIEKFIAEGTVNEDDNIFEHQTNEGESQNQRLMQFKICCEMRMMTHLILKKKIP